jgi:CRISPR-associated protein Cmr2
VNSTRHYALGAIVNTKEEDMKHLFLCGIGPVQEFIASARRSRDLWYGSWMLSELSKAAAKKIGELSPPGELIFPYSIQQESAPNKVVAIIDGDPKQIAEGERGIQAALRARLNELWQDARSHVNGRIDDRLAQDQIDDLLEFYWVSVPYTGSYAVARDTAEHLLAARKVTRDFKPADGRPIPKSSLDGARESVIPEDAYPGRNDPLAAEKTKNLYKSFHARRGEQLSGVDLLKRLGQPEKSPRFKSTSDMAAIPFVENIKDGRGRELLEKIKALLPDDGDRLERAEEGLVFESRFADGFPSQENEKREQFLDLLNEYAGKSQPNPYYALLAADGDNMGMAIDAQTELQAHRDLSKALSDFASSVPEAVRKSKGVLIYAGGDDVLAYLPLHTVLGFAKEIEADFRATLQKFKTKGGTAPTLSVGIAVTHHVEPLSDALELARKAEREAKSVPGKSGLAVIVSKRSGTDRTIRGNFAELVERLDKLVGFSEEGAISAGAAYELQNLHRDLSKTGIPADGLAQEAVRIISRKREAGTAEGIQEKVQKAFKEWIAPDQGKPVAVNELALEMIVARMFASNEKEAV